MVLMPLFLKRCAVLILNIGKKSDERKLLVTIVAARNSTIFFNGMVSTVKQSICVNLFLPKCKRRQATVCCTPSLLYCLLSTQSRAVAITLQSLVTERTSLCLLLHCGN